MPNHTKTQPMNIDVLTERATRLAEDHRTFLRQLIAARKQSGLSQEQVAERMGVSQPAVSKFERYDANPTLETIRRYALAIGVSLRSSVLSVPEDDWKPLATSQQNLSAPEPVNISGPWSDSHAKGKATLRV